MKTRNILSILTLFALSFSFAQTGEVHYTIKSLIDEPVNEMGKKINSEIALMSYKLLYNDISSYFEQEPYVPLDEYYAGFAIIAIGASNPLFNIVKRRKVC